MPSFCAVVGCSNRAERDSVRFFRIPAFLNNRGSMLETLSSERREAWIRALKRGPQSETFLNNARICSKHFVSGAPADLSDKDNPDWVPSINMGYISIKKKTKQGVQRHERSMKKLKRDEVLANVESQAGPSTQLDCEPSEETDMETTGEEMVSILKEDLDMLHNDLRFCNEKMYEMQKRLNLVELTEESFMNNDTKTKYFTGFPKTKVMILVFNQISCYLLNEGALPPFKQFLLTVMKLRLNLPFMYLSYQFGISPSMTSEIFYHCIDVLYERFKKLVFWPDRVTLKKTMPLCFRRSFNDKIAVIINCFEIFIEKPSELLNSVQCWSHYKHHETVKYLIGITPQGTISYISEGWGGRTSHNHIAENSGFLNLILPGDFVMADREFLIEEAINISGAHLEITVFIKEGTQLQLINIEKTHKISNVRIHVERLTGLLRKKYQIFRDPIPLSFLSTEGDNMSMLDKIVIVCSAFVNMCPSIVPMD